MTPAEKKANELAEQYSITKADTILDELAIEQHFEAGFRAALELAEVKGLEEALKLYAPHGLNAKEALTKWREFVGREA